MSGTICSAPGLNVAVVRYDGHLVSKSLGMCETRRHKDISEKERRTLKAKLKNTAHFPSVDDLIANATDFLKSATADLSARPKHSVIAFYTAIELILKARLMAEHWTLVVSKNADRNNFAKGDFVSITFDEACTRLQSVIGSPLPDNAKAIFNSLRKHRNKMVHFYHDGETDQNTLENIALEQLLGWRALVSLMEHQWQSIFVNMAFDITAIDEGFAEHRLYAKAKFETLAERLKGITDSGGVLVTCHSCTFKAAECDEELEAVFSSRCFVCNAYRRWMVTPCPSCSRNMTNEGDDGASCEPCGARFSIEELVEALNEEVITNDNYLESLTPANCASCDGYHTVISWKDSYVCLNCIEYTDELGQCGFCGEGNNGDLQLSGMFGCSACDGNVKLMEE